MENFDIYRKRDGQSFNRVSSISANDFNEACKIFAKQMTDDNHNLSNNIQWLEKEKDGVQETGWYDFNCGHPVYNEQNEKYNDAHEVADFLLVSETAINEGFCSWNEDVYTWEVRESKKDEEE